MRSACCSGYLNRSEDKDIVCWRYSDSDNFFRTGNYKRMVGDSVVDRDRVVLEKTRHQDKLPTTQDSDTEISSSIPPDHTARDRETRAMVLFIYHFHAPGAHFYDNRYRAHQHVTPNTCA